MNAALRELRAEDDPRELLAVVAECTPEHAQTPEEWRYWHALDPGRCDIVALDGERPLGAAFACEAYDTHVTGTLFAGVYVVETARRKGLGTRLLDALETAAAARGLALEPGVSDGRPDALAFFEGRGYGEVMREQIVALELATAAAPAAALPPGIAIVTLAERPDLLEDVYRVSAEAYLDIPAPEATPAEPFDAWRARHTGAPSACAEAFAIALDGDDVAGYAALDLPPARPGVGWHHMTAVARPQRGLGLGRALKEWQIAWARERGLERLETENAEDNEPIRRLNERLGYRHVRWQIWLRPARDAASSS